MNKIMMLAGISFATLVAACSQQDLSTLGLPAQTVQPSVETVNVSSTDDAADDPAVWLHEDPAQSLILGTDKRNGLYAYNLDGSVHTFLQVGRVNNVDIRTGFDLGDRQVALAAASDRTNIAIATFFIDPADRSIVEAPGGVLPLANVEDPYGFCLYHDQSDGAVYGFVSDAEPGTYVQVRLTWDGQAMQGEEVRRFTTGTKSEGCVVDDRTGYIYVAEEEVGIWRYSAAPNAGDERILIAEADGQHLTFDIEGLAIMEQGETGGWLFASSQGDNAYAIFDLETSAFVDRFRVVDSETIDGTSYTDGIEVFAHAIGDIYPEGIFVAQDDEDDQGTQNFKVVDLRAIKAVAGSGYDTE